MPAVKMIYECPRCFEGISSQSRPKFCPNCKNEFGPVTETYTAPMTLTEQFKKLRTADAYARFIQRLSIEKSNDILNDALSVVEMLPGKMSDISDIRIVVGLAKRIGEIATKYEEFLQAGGKHPHSILNPTQPIPKETQNGNPTPARTGGETP